MPSELQHVLGAHLGVRCERGQELAALRGLCGAVEALPAEAAPLEELLDAVEHARHRAEEQNLVACMHAIAPVLVLIHCDVLHEVVLIALRYCACSTPYMRSMTAHIALAQVHVAKPLCILFMLTSRLAVMLESSTS